MTNSEVFIDQDKISKICVVCGWADGTILSIGEICPCCGIEWGYEDFALSNVLKERERWIDSGYKWSIENLKPENWSAEEQLKNIPEEYR